MTAEEMFMKLGYIKYIRPASGNILYCKQNFIVEFSAIKQTVATEFVSINYRNTLTYRALDVDVALFQAIKKQLEELGWLE